VLLAIEGLLTHLLCWLSSASGYIVSTASGKALLDASIANIACYPSFEEARRDWIEI